MCTTISTHRITLARRAHPSVIALDRQCRTPKRCLHTSLRKINNYIHKCCIHTVEAPHSQTFACCKLRVCGVLCAYLRVGVLNGQRTFHICTENGRGEITRFSIIERAHRVVAWWCRGSIGLSGLCACDWEEGATCGIYKWFIHTRVTTSSLQSVLLPYVLEMPRGDAAWENAKE